MTSTEPAELSLALRAAARAYRQRRILVLAGTAIWARAAGVGLRDALNAKAALWVGDLSQPGWLSCTPHSARSLLGHEFDLVCMDAFAGFDPDDFGVISGALVSGGLLCLLCPPLNAWPLYDDPEYARISVTGAAVRSGRFLKRLVEILEKAPGVYVLNEDGQRSGDPCAMDVAEVRVPGPSIAADGCVNEEQRAAVMAVLHAAKGHRRRPVVLTAHRGRGKSAALGLAAAALMAEKETKIVVTGPSLASVESVFAHASARLPESRREKSEMYYGGSRLCFVAPDALAEAPIAADLVLVDEAAALPQGLLQRLLHVFPRLAFATTVHGYEGSGRAFALRFQAQLDAELPGWRNITLHSPVRWSNKDPLEALSFRTLLLDAEPADPDMLSHLSCADTEFEQIDRNDLVSNETLLGEVFGLLVFAHYRTRPLDLRQLLDGPTVSVWVARYRGHVAGVALLAEEGGLLPDLAAEVAQGRRRARGHLLPQVLAAHCGRPDSMSLRGWRVLRLAVHPVAQRRRLGSALLAQLEAEASVRSLDWVGASFGATPELLAFWQQAGFMPVRIGVTREAITGAHAALVISPLSTEAEMLRRALRQRYLDLVPHLLGDTLRNIDPKLAGAMLLREVGDVPAPDLPSELRRDAYDFACGMRDYEDALGALWRLAIAALSHIAFTSAHESRLQDALVMKVLQKRDWAATAKRLELPGRAQVVDLLRAAVRAFLG